MSNERARKSFLELLASAGKPDLDTARQMLDLAIALELPGRVIEAVRQYITDAGAAMESKDVADQAAREARESWRQVESMAERGEDLFDGGG